MLDLQHLHIMWSRHRASGGTKYARPRDRTAFIRGQMLAARSPGCAALARCGCGVHVTVDLNGSVSCRACPQDVQGRNCCLVEVTTRAGKGTKAYMFVSFCANCRLGLPVQMFAGNNTQCMRCVECKRVDRVNRTGKREERELGPDDQWIDMAHALSLKPVAECEPGMCQALGCTSSAQRCGDAQGRGMGTGDFQKLCSVHAPVRDRCPRSLLS